MADDLSTLSDDDLKSAYSQSTAPDHGLAAMSDDDLKRHYERAVSPGGFNLGRGIWTGPEADAWTSAAMGHVLHAFGQGAWDAWDHGKDLGYSDDVNEWMQKVGIYNDVGKGQGSILRTYNEALIRPAVAATFGVTGAFFRSFGSAISGFQAGAQQAGEETGQPGIGRTIAGLPEAFPLFGHETGGLHGVPALPRPVALGQELGRELLSVHEVNNARDLGLIGPVRPAETMPMGTMIIRRGGAVDAAMDGEAMHPYGSTIGADLLPPEVEPPATIHEAARAIAPATFSEYDAAARLKDELRGRIDDAQTALRTSAEAQAPHQAEIADLERRLEDTTPRLAKKYTARLAELRPARDAFLADDFTMSALTRDTAEIQAMREDLQRADIRMRDLSPEVTAAYRAASQHFPEPEAEPLAPAEAAPVEASAAASVPPVERAAAAVESTPAAAPVATPAVEAPVVAPTAAVEAKPAVPIDIRSDVVQKLVAAGRPAEEATAAAELVAAHYESRSARFAGANGTAADLYTREAPDIVAGERRGRRVRELAQRNGQTLYQRDAQGNAVPLYSPVERAVEGLKQAKGTGEQMLAAITKTAGVKPEEMKWLGLDTWLKGQRSVSKQEIQNYIAANALDVREVVKGQRQVDWNRLYDIQEEKRAALMGALPERLSEPIPRPGGEESVGTASGIVHWLNRGWIKPDDLPAEYRAAAHEFVDATADVGRETTDGGDTKFGQYTLPGGENYREMLITLPPKAEAVPPRPTPITVLPAGYNVTFDRTAPPSRQWAVVPPGQEHGRPFEGQHGSETAAVHAAVARINTDAVDRWQSDYLRTVPEGTYRSSHWDEPNVVAHTRFSERTAPDGAKVLHIEEVQSDWHQAGRRAGYRPDQEAALEALIRQRNALPEGIERDAVQDQIGFLGRSEPGVPDAPFKTTWPMLAMKRMVQYAVDHGFDRVAWTPGDVQADRYSLATQVKSIIAIRRADKYDLTVTENNRGNRQHELNGLTEQQLVDNVGKDMAERIIQQPDEMHHYAGDGLKVGGAGMKSFYDRMLPSEVQKLIGKFGSHVEQSEIGTGQPERDTLKPDAQAVKDHDAAWQNIVGQIREIEAKQPPHTGNTPETMALHAKLDDIHRQMIDETLARAQNTQAVHSFEITDRMKAAVKQEGLPLFQTTRGKINLNAGRSVITLMRDANASTFLHETGHAWLEELFSDGRDPAAPAELQADVATVRKWLGAEPDAAITTPQHEKFARGFERYMMEGVAPSQALARVFAQFRDWLVKIYQTVNRLRAPINDDIRDVFNRLLEVRDQPTTIAAERAGPGRDMTASVAPVKPPDPYEKLPKEPKRLIQFLKEGMTLYPGTIHELKIPGGIRDVGGDVAAIIGGPKGRPGLINNASGRHLDAATEHAFHNGYFPEHDQRPEINHLLDKIREDHTGNPQYSMHDQEQVAAFHAALDHNAEIDRLSTEHGIDTKGLTRDQFFDKITEKLSVDQIAEEIQSQDEAHAGGFGDVDDEVRDTSEPPLYGIDQPRSLEDLENAIRQEDAARSARQDDAGDPGSGSAAGSADDGEAGSGSRGRVAGSAGGSGAQAGERAGGGRGAGGAARSDQQKPIPQPTKPDADELVDKAGNIRLDNLNSPDDVKQILRDLAAQNADFMVSRGGVISDATRRDMADNLGLTVEGFSPNKPPGVSPSVWADAVQKLTFQATTEVSTLGKTFGDTGSPADGLAYLQAKQRLLMIADHFAGLTAEAGRTLRVFDKEGMTFTGDLVAKMQQDTGRTLYQMQQEAKAVGALDTAAQRAKMVQDTKELTTGQRVKAGIISYFINNLISGPITHAGYGVGNEVWSLFKAIPLTLAEAAVDSARAAFGTVAADRVYYGEVGAQLYGMMHGALHGFGPGMKALKNGISYMEGADLLRLAADEARGQGQGTLAGMSPLGEAMLRPAAIGNALEAMKVPASVAQPIGYVLETPSRAVAAIHTIFYSMNYEREIARRSFRAAANEGLTGLEFSNRVAELSQSPPLEMIQAAHDEALTAVLMKRPDYGGAQSKITSVVNNSLPFKLMMPFMQIGMNILEEGLIKTSPIGLASQAVRDNLAGRNGEVARSQQFARIMVGSGLAAGIMGLASQGLITGGGPSDQNERALKEATGWKAYSIRIGDTYIPYRKYLGPLGPLVGGAANMFDVGHLMSAGDYTKAAGAAVLGFTEVVADETWMRGLSNLFDATRHWDRAGERYLRDLALSFVPFSVGLSQTARVLDDYQREVHSWTDALRNKLPGLSRGLYPQRDWTGREIDSHTMMTPSIARNDKTMAQMQAAEFYPAHLSHDILGVPLSDKQYDDYARVAGLLAKQRMDALVRTPGFTDQPAGFQHKMMSDTLSGARRAAATYVELQPDNTNILRQAIAAKQATVEGKTQAEVKAVRRQAVTTP